MPAQRRRTASMRLRHPVAILRVALATIGLAFVFLALQPILSARAMEIQKVRSPNGIEAWLVEDYSVPIVAIRFAFRGGSVQDPDGKEGLTALMTSLFDESAGDLAREAFQDRLDDSGAEIGFSSGRDEIFGSMRAIDTDLDEAFAILALSIQSPRFDDEPIARLKSQTLNGIEAQSRDPEAAADIAWMKALYGTHPYARRAEGTAETVAALTRDDLVAQHRKLLARDNLVMSVVGAIDAESVERRLDEVFGALPEHAELRDIAEAEIRFDQELRVDYDLPQTSIRLAYPGVAREDPRFFPAFLMNEVLGGGTFSSRLFREVREKRGLTYGIGSGLSTPRHASALTIGTAVRADRAEESLGVIRDEIARMAESGPTAEELAEAKRYTIGAYPISNLDSSAAIARTLVELQLEDLGIDYIERREALIDAVTLDQTREEARRLLSASPSVMLVGPSAQGSEGNAAEPGSPMPGVAPSGG